MTRARPAFVSHSPETGSDYTIYVDAPPGGAPTPAVLMMDGDFMFDAAAGAARKLAAAGRIPPTVVVGVGYGAGFGSPGNNRGRDYTPTASSDEPSSGGADAFLRYLRRTLWPGLRGRHALREDRRVIAGHSLGSLLVLHALFQEEPFFTLALASAPSIWWDNRSVLALIARRREGNASLEGKLYLCVGEKDTPSMLGDLALLEAQLRMRPFEGLGVEGERFADKDHYNVLETSMTAGLASLLG
jgi:hypothetical protein